MTASLILTKLLALSDLSFQRPTKPKFSPHQLKTRTISKARIKNLSADARKARKHLDQNGYTYETAAIALKRDRTHLALVLSGKRTSAALLSRILNLPPLSKEGTHA